MAKMDRRDFLKAGSVATVGTYFAGSQKMHLMAAPVAEPAKPIAANDHIQIALIGAGGQGQGDTKIAAMVPGVKVVAAADCYDGCLDHAKELWGNDILTTRDYNEILARKDIDAVIIGTPDHWHMQASIDAMNAGKDVYCEKPMIHVYSDGPKIIDTWRKTNRIMQVGSQRVSSIIYKKAKELLAAGAIGKLNMVTVWYDRNSAHGAWEYTVPTMPTPTTCDWPRWLGTAPQIPFDGERFFQWRKYKDYGSGVAGDLFVHLFSGVHLITDTHGPTRAQATGGLRFWKDGRDVPDVMMALYDYEKGFNLSVRTNFVDGGVGERRVRVYGLGRLDDDSWRRRHHLPRTARDGAGVSRRPLFGAYSEAHDRGLSREVSHAPRHRDRPRGRGKIRRPQRLQRPLRPREELDRSHPHAPTCGGRPCVRIPRCRRRTA